MTLGWSVRKIYLLVRVYESLLLKMIFLTSCETSRRFFLAKFFVLFSLFLGGVSVQNAYGALSLPQQLDSAIRLAIMQHPEAMEAESEVLGARAVVSSGQFRWYPRVEASSRLGRNDDRALNFGIKQSIWDFGRVNAEFDSAKASELVAIAKKLNVRESIGIRVSSAYLNVLRTREQKLVADKSVESHRILYLSVDRRKDAGLGAKSDVMLASSRLQQARSAAALWEGEIGRAEAAYFSVVNERPPISMNEIGLAEADQNLQYLIDKAKARSPELARLKSELMVAEANVKSQVAQQFPTLFARVDHANYLGSSAFADNDTRFTVNFEWQNDVALSQRYRVAAAEQKVAAARYGYEAAERKLVEALAANWQDFIASRQRYDELSKFSISAADTVDMFKRQFVIGRRSWPEVVNSLQDLYSAQSQMVEAKYKALSAKVNLAFTGGEMDEYIWGFEQDQAEKAADVSKLGLIMTRSVREPGTK